MYLLLSKKGYFVTLSREAAEQKCRCLHMQKDSIIICSSFEHAKHCIRIYGHEYETTDIQFNTVTFWKPLRMIVLIDLPAEESWRCSSDGSVLWRQRGRKAISYKICQNHMPDGKKTRALLKKYGVLRFYDFEIEQVLYIFANGEVRADCDEL